MVDEILRREDVSGIHHLVMNHGPNALSPELMVALTGTLAELRAGGAPPLLLTSSHPMVFCPGWDLKREAGAGRDRVAGLLEAFNRLVHDLFSYPAPTGAAIGGHAVAGGCLLALCCDLRIMGVGRPRIGLSELNLGVPIPVSSLLMLRQRLAPNVVEEMVVRGDGCNAERAHDLGVVHRVSELDLVVSKTHLELARLASKPQPAFAATKRFLLEETWSKMAAPSPAADEAFLDCWFSEETQRRIAHIVTRLGD